MHEPRTKSYLMRGLKNWARKLKPSDLGLSDDIFSIEYRHESETNLSFMVRMTDDAEAMPRYYQIKLTERL